LKKSREHTPVPKKQYQSLGAMNRAVRSVNSRKRP
jgi:hypothetical protein